MSDLLLYQVTFAGNEFSAKLYAFPSDVNISTVITRVVDQHPDKRVKSITLAAEGVLLCGSVVDFD